MTYLFLGGPWDGQRRVVLEQLPMIKILHPVYGGDEGYEYHRTFLLDVVVYIHSTVDNPMTLLLAGYQPPKTQETGCQPPRKLVALEP